MRSPGVRIKKKKKENQTANTQGSQALGIERVVCKLQIRAKIKRERKKKKKRKYIIIIKENNENDINHCVRGKREGNKGNETRSEREGWN